MRRRRPTRGPISTGVIVAGIVVVASILAPWLVIRINGNDQAPALNTVTLPAPTETAFAMPSAEVASQQLTRPTQVVAAAPAAPTARPSATAAPPTAAAPPATTASSPAPSETPPPTAAPTLTPLPTAFVTRASEPTATAIPSATPVATSTVTPSRPPTDTPVPTVVLRALPTATRPVRPTARPTRRPAVSLSPAPATPPYAPPPGVFVSAPAVAAPGYGAYVSGVTRFSWQPTGPLPEGGGYEVVWWNSDEQPGAGRAFQAATPNTSIDVNLDSLYRAGQFTGSQIYWTVLAVRLSPYERWMSPAEGERGTFFYAAPGGGGTAGSQPTAPPPPK